MPIGYLKKKQKINLPATCNLYKLALRGCDCELGSFYEWLWYKTFTLCGISNGLRKSLATLAKVFGMVGLIPASFGDYTIQRCTINLKTSLSFYHNT